MCKCASVRERTVVEAGRQGGEAKRNGRAVSGIDLLRCDDVRVWSRGWIERSTGGALSCKDHAGRLPGGGGGLHQKANRQSGARRIARAVRGKRVDSTGLVCKVLQW